MDEQQPVLVRMNSLLTRWEAAQDRRLIFLSCYRMMTQNILTAIETKEFEDPAWVNTLMENFANYYFQALDAYESDPSQPPAAWQIAFKAANSPHIHAMQNLVLGVNAHINYDLVFALSELLGPEWPHLNKAQRQLRYRDHCKVNEVISQTIDAVQDQVIDRYEPAWGVVDKMLGPIDEWMTSLFISRWREEVWEHAVQILDPDFLPDRQTIFAHVQQTAIERAEDILGKGKLSALIDFI
jgi:hypothetical protein